MKHDRLGMTLANLKAIVLTQTRTCRLIMVFLLQVALTFATLPTHT